MLRRKSGIVLVVALTVAGLSCTGNDLDDGSGADVVLQVRQVQVPPITAALDPATSICTFRITESTATLNNVPKSVGAITSPANDILVTELAISYLWDDGFVTPPSLSSPRIVVPADGTNQVRFNAIPLDSLINAGSPRDGHSAEMTMVFTGQTESGEHVEALGGAVLIVNSCQ